MLHNLTHLLQIFYFHVTKTRAKYITLFMLLATARIYQIFRKKMEIEKKCYEEKSFNYKAAHLAQASPESPDGRSADHYIFNDRLGYFGVFDSAGYKKEAIDAGIITSRCFQRALNELHLYSPLPKAEYAKEALISGWRSSIVSIENYSTQHQEEIKKTDRWNPTTTAVVGQICYDFHNKTRSFETLFAGDSRAYVFYDDGSYDKTPDEALIYDEVQEKNKSKTSNENYRTCG